MSLRLRRQESLCCFFCPTKSPEEIQFSHKKQRQTTNKMGYIFLSKLNLKVKTNHLINFLCIYSLINQVNIFNPGARIFVDSCYVPDLGYSKT